MKLSFHSLVSAASSGPESKLLRALPAPSLPEPRPNRGRLPAALTAIAFILAVHQAHAASVGTSGIYTNDLRAQPPVADWTTVSQPGTPDDAYDLDAHVNANITVGSVTESVVAEAANPPAANALATWSSTGFHLQTRPAGNRYTALLGKFQNNSGTNATEIALSYLASVAAGGVAEENGKGTRVYYSLSGEAGSWVNVPALNSTASANGSAVASANLTLSWTNRGYLYLLWADDNAEAGDDAAHQIANFSLRVLNGTLAFSCTLNQPANNTFFLSTASITMQAGVRGGTTPYVVSYWTNTGPGNTVYGLAAVRSNLAFVNLGRVAAGNYNIFSSATDQGGLGNTIYSPTNAFRVSDLISFVLTEPTNGSVFQYSTPVVANATLSGGTPPHAVQFYLNGAPYGAPMSAPPFVQDFGLVTIGNHTLRATVTDARGWVSNSLTHAFEVTGPLTVTLTPTNETTYYYGQSVTLSLAGVGGSPPYTAIFYTNGQPASTAGPAPALLNLPLGLLPIGTYTHYATAFDDAGASTNSSTNVFTILDNPLSVQLTTPTNGQRLGQGSAVTAAVTIGAPVTVSVEFFVDGVSIGTDNTAPYALATPGVGLGSHTVYAVARDSLGRDAYTTTNQMTVVPVAGGVVGPAGYANSFEARPAAAEWATFSRTGAANDSYNMDTDVNATITASGVTAQTASDTGNPPAANANAVWSSSGLYLQLRPTGNRYTALMGKFVNESGTNATQLTLSYLFTIAAAGTTAEDAGLGTRAYYSLTGLANSWVNIPELNTTAAANGSTNLSVNLAINWTNGAALYLLLADDNAVGTGGGGGGGTDAANQFDNLALRVTAGMPPLLTVTVSAPSNGAVLEAGTPMIASASVVYGTPPYAVEYFLSAGEGNPVFTSVGASAEDPYPVSLGSLTAGTYNLYAAAVDNGSPVETALSLTNTFVVADPLTATLTAPTAGASFDYLTPVAGTAHIQGGVPPYSVQFYLDGAAAGAPVTSAPYAYDFGPLFVGSHTIRAQVTDATGWTSSSATHTINVTGPLGVLLTPDDGSLWLYGAPMTLAAQVGGGTGPYTVTFYVNDQSVGVLTAPPFVVDLGLLALGDYAAYVHVADNSTPTPQQIYSSTNLLSIVANPLLASLTSPTNGQSVATNSSFNLSATATVGAPVTVQHVQFFFDGALVGTDSSAPYAIQVSGFSLGSHTVYARATDSLGRIRNTATNVITGVNDPLANNHFTNRLTLVGPIASYSGSNVGANTETGEPTGSGFNTFGATLWWTWTAPATGTVVINTAGSGFNTSLGVYTGSAVNALTQVAFSGSAFGGGTPQVSFTAQQGTQYQIQVGGMTQFFGGSGPATGTYQLNLQMPASASISSPTNNSIFLAGTNYLITANASSPNGAIVGVDFYLSGSFIGRDTETPYSFMVNNAPAGTNVLTVVATDSVGITATSAVVRVLAANLGITITSPADGATFPGPTNVSVSVFPYLPVGSITNVEFLANDQRFASDSTAPFSMVWSNVPRGSHQLTAIGLDNAGNRYEATPVYIAVASTLVPTGSVWKYFDSGWAPQATWTSLGFDDATWASGRGELGYGDGDEATVVNSGPANNFFITTYFRHVFVISNLANYSGIILNVKRDDGAVVYLNGVEAARFNMPSGPVTYDTLANNAADDGANFWPATVPATMLREGTNVIAAEVHQTSSTSSDLSFEMSLLGVPVIIRNQYPSITLANPANGTFALAPAAFGLRAEAADADGSITQVEFFNNGAKLGEDAQAPYALSVRDLPPGVYSFTAVATDDRNATKKSAAATVTVYEPARRWAAFNDHYAGPGTHPNATAWNAFGTDGGAPGDEGYLRNISTRGSLPARLTVMDLGAYADPACGAPLPGTPAYDLFHGYVDFGTGDRNHAILVGADGMVIHLFTGLDPARRYSFRATVVGGVPAYSNRWTLCTLLGAEGFAGAHTPNVISGDTNPALFEADEAAMNTGDNRTGDVFGWDSIAPGPDGSFLVLSTQYLGPAPGNARPGPVAYVPVAIRLEEQTGQPLVKITAPVDGYIVEGPTNVTMAVTAQGVAAITNVVFLGDYLVLGSDTASPYGFTWTNVAFGAHVLQAVACDLEGVCATSAPVNITVTIPPTNTVPPIVLAQVPEADFQVTSLSSIQVFFSEPVVGVDAADLLVNDTPAYNVTGSGSNYTFFAVQPPYGPVTVRFAAGHGITDAGWPERLPFDENSPTALWQYTLVDRAAPTLIAKEPPANATLTNLTEVTVYFSEFVTGVNAADFLVNGVPAFEAAGSGGSYTFFFAQPASGTVAISWATNHGITDLASVRNPFNATGAGATWNYTLDAKLILVESNAFWRFAKGTNEASTPTNAWRQPGFNDSGWTQAPAPFFYGDPYSNGVPAFTHLTDMRSNYTGIYLRKPFYVPNADHVTNLLLRAQIDDGMIVWINGIEVLRTNVAAGEIPYSGTAMTASQDQNGAPYITFPLPDPSTYLQTGTNVLAVHALNESLSTSSDFGFNAQLFTYQTDTEAVPPRILRRDPPAGYEFALTSITVTFTEPVTGVNATDLLLNGVAASGMTSATNVTYTFTFAQPAYGLVNVTWAEPHGITDTDFDPKPFDGNSSSARWQYQLLNSDSPYLLSVVPEQDSTIADLTAITVAFSKGVVGVDAADLLVNGAPATGLQGSGATYTFTFPQPAYGAVSVIWAGNHGIRDAGDPLNPFDPFWPGHTWTYRLMDRVAPTIAAQFPAASGWVTNLTAITVVFSEPVSGVDASDLLINGVAATNRTGAGTTYTFNFRQPNSREIHVAWALTHGIRDVATVPNAFDATAPGARWSYPTADNVPPALASVIPAPGSAGVSLREITVAFDEPVSGVNGASLTVNGMSATGVMGAGAGPYTFAFEQPATGVVQVALSAAIFDLAAQPNAYAGSNWTYVLDPNLPPPTLTRGPYLQIQTPTSMTIRWRTTTATDSRVEYRVSGTSQTNVVANPVVGTEHIIILTNLTPATRYFYACGTTDGRMLRDTNFYFDTAPPVGTVRPTRIWYVSDFGFGDANERAVRDSYFTHVASEKPADVWITGGDNDQRSGTDAGYNDYVFGTNWAYGWLLRNLAVWPTPGNHDYSTAQGANYFAAFTLPTQGEAGGVPSGSEAYYSFDYANIHFINFDGIDGTKSASTNTPMVQWLIQDLAANTQPWVVAYWHGPPYTKGSHDSDDANNTLAWMVQMRENVVPILEAYGVDLTICGHSHVHERTWLIHGHYGFSSSFSESHKIDGGDGKLHGTGAYRQTADGRGTVHVSNGMGGQPRTATSEQHRAHIIKLTGMLGSVVIDVNDNQLDLKFINTSGQALDYFTLVKNGDGGPQLLITRAGDITTVTWPKSAEEFDLWWSPSVGQAEGWQMVTSGIETEGDAHVYRFNSAANGTKGFFQLKQR